MSTCLYLAPEIWKAVATSSVHTHELRTACNVARDLSSLQSVCKSSQGCAADVWPQVAALCSHCGSVQAVSTCTLKQLKSRLPRKEYSEETLDRALRLPPEKLVTFIQTQWDKDVFLYGGEAAKKYRLSPKDLECVKHQLIRNFRNRSAPARRYCRQDVIDAANKKWHSVEALQKRDQTLRQAAVKRHVNKKAKWEASDEGKAQLQQQKEQAEKEAALRETAPARRAALTASLAALGLEFFETDDELHSVKLYEPYLCEGEGDPDKIAAKAKELQWLFANTEILRQMRDEEDYD